MAFRRHSNVLVGGLGLALASAALVTAPPARADEKQTCIAAYEKAQQLRLDGKLRAAREQLTVCSRPECPSIVRQDCNQWMGEVLQSLPSVVIAARDASGKDLMQVRVYVDGTVVSDQLDGKPLYVDPGPHKFRYEASGMPPVDIEVLVRSGERNRPVTATLKVPNDDKDRDRDKDVDKDKRVGGELSTGSDGRGAPILAYTLVGLGVLGVGAAAYFGLTGNADAQDLRKNCAPSCPQSDVDAVQTKYTIAWVSGGVGVAAAAIGTILLLTRASSSASSGAATSSRASAWTFGVAPTPGGGAAALGGRF